MGCLNELKFCEVSRKYISSVKDISNVFENFDTPFTHVCTFLLLFVDKFLRSVWPLPSKNLLMSFIDGRSPKYAKYLFSSSMQEAFMFIIWVVFA